MSTDPRRDVMVLDEISRSLQEAEKITLNQSALKREDCIRMHKRFGSSQGVQSWGGLKVCNGCLQDFWVRLVNRASRRNLKYSRLAVRGSNTVGLLGFENPNLYVDILHPGFQQSQWIRSCPWTSAGLTTMSLRAWQRSWRWT